MTNAPQRVVFVSRTAIDVDSNAGEVARKSLGGNTDAIRKGGDLVELYRVLHKLAKCVWVSVWKLTFSSATTVASPRLPAHVTDFVREADTWPIWRDSGLIDLGLNIIRCGVRTDAGITRRG